MRGARSDEWSSAQKLAESMGRFEVGDAKPIELWSWVNHALMASTTGSVYGPKNPFKDPEIGNAYL